MKCVYIEKSVVVLRFNTGYAVNVNTDTEDMTAQQCAAAQRLNNSDVYYTICRTHDNFRTNYICVMFKTYCFTSIERKGAYSYICNISLRVPAPHLQRLGLYTTVCTM